MISSKFAQRRRIQPTPPVCKKGPPPTHIFDPDYQQTPLQAWAHWYAPVYGGTLNLSTLFTIDPGPGYFEWQGLSEQAYHQLKIELIYLQPVDQWNVWIRHLEDGYEVKAYSLSDVPLQTLQPFATELLQFIQPENYQQIEAWIAF